MSRDDSFFQFPVAAIYTGKHPDHVTDDEQHRYVQRIINYCLHSLAESANDRDVGEVEETAVGYCERMGLPRPKSRAHQRAYHAAVTLDINFPSASILDLLPRDYNEIASRAYGNKQVRIRSDLLWSANNHEFSWREFSILCGVLAGVGAKPFHRLSFDYIATMSYGVSNFGERGQLIGDDCQLTRRQVRYTIEKLDRRNIFRRASPDGRRMYYTVRMAQDELMNALAKSLAAKCKPKGSQRSATEAIRRVASQMAPRGTK